MKPVLVKKENNSAVFTMAFSAEEFEDALTESFKKNRGRFAVDGFRKGKAPRSIIERWYGPEVFFEDAIDDLCNKGYADSLKELALDPIDRPTLDLGEEKLERGKGFTATITVAVRPEPEIKDYKGLAIERTVHPVTDEEVDASIEALRKRNARLINVERPAANGDTVILDYAGFVGEEQFEGGTAENQSLELGSGTFIPGFEEQLVGVSAGESQDVKVTFPEEYHEPTLAGKEAVFKCTVHEVKSEDLPELDDEFAKDVSEFDTLAELKADTRSGLEKRYAEAADNAAKNKAIDLLIEKNAFDVPEVMIRDEEEVMYNDFAQNMAYQGINMEMYTKITGKSADDIRGEFAEQAEKSVRSRIVAAQIAAQEKLSVTDEELEDEFGQIAKDYGMTVEQVKKAFGGSEFVRTNLLARKAVDLVYANAKVTDVEEKPAEETPADAK